jgi:SAM-dependent methyltransferase
MTIVHDYHLRQYEQCYETTARLLEFADDTLAEMGSRRILDVACGAGANVYHMLKRWPAARVTGIDLDPELIDYAQSKVPPEFAPRCRYEQGNLFELDAKFGAKEFEITTLMQTLLLFGPDDYAEVLRSLMKVTSEWIFLSSLFTDKRMDVTSQIRDYVRFGEDSKETLTYNILCMSRFRRICEQLGAREVLFCDFSIGLDLTGPAEGGIGTYTARLGDGRRLQFSGAVFMPWKFAALRLR